MATPKSIVEQSHDNVLSFDDYTEELNNLSEKYGVLPREVNKIANSIENAWIENIINEAY